MANSSYILTTAGHIDHGKSALVQALTGTNPDRLPEEKRRGITIDLGFAHLQLPGFDIGIIDVPGHEDFVKNMVAGVGSIDAALLVVAANDGWMPQTEEHLQILTHIGVQHGLVALTKIDLVADPTAAIAEIRRHLTGTFLEQSPIIPTAAPTRRGIADLKSALAAVLANTPSPRDIAKPRLPIDRVFSLKGFGTIVTGTLAGGALSRGQSVTVYPSASRTRIRSIQNHNRPVDTAPPGSRVALNLPDLPPTAVHRGDTISLAGSLLTSSVIDVQLHRAAPGPPLKTGQLVQIHHASAAIPTRVRLLDTGLLEPGSTSLARLKLKAPLSTAVGDRFILRDWSQHHTLAGGLILDPAPHDPRRRLPRNPQALQDRAAAIDNPTAYVQSQLQLEGIAHRDHLGAATHFAAIEIADAIDRLIRSSHVIAAGDSLLIEPTRWQQLRSSAEQAVDALHRAHPDRSGLPLADLPPLALAALPRHAADLAPPLAEALLTSLTNDGFARVATIIRRQSHRPNLPPRLQPSANQIRAQLQAHPFDPPSRKELAPSDLAQQALRFMIATAELVEISPEVVLHADAYADAKTRIRQHITNHGPATVADLKTLLGSSRRIMVPLLEKLDKDHVTQRQGDRRLLAKAESEPRNSL